jgi:Ca-activated chloride channel family protein
MTQRNVLGLLALSATAAFSAQAPPTGRITQGSLMTLDSHNRFQAECPLQHTDVKADIAGFLSRVTVTQDFVNNAADKIEAVYVFPLPNNAAVDDMTMLVGSRSVRGLIKRREDARAIYEAARAKGQVAGLLDQERPNIFTQSVANIMPGEKVRITISYVETLKFEDGQYEFVFPMVVGPRYIPGKAAGRTGGGWAYDTDAVPDASKITPPVAVPGTRAGHDISIEVALDAGLQIASMNCNTHDIVADRNGSTRATIKLRDKAVIPNKDFVLKYDIAGQKIGDTVLMHHGSKGGFFTMIFQPPDRVVAQDVTPKELVFVLDTSGSMFGFPIEKAKEAMRDALDGLNPRDTFNLITFSGDTQILFPHPVPATPENLARAKHLMDTRSGSGGTEMMKAIRAALDPSDGQDHVRIVCFMTDGYVGNDNEIIAEVGRHPNARVFAFGIGSAVNRHLLDKMAEQGRGEVEYVGLSDDGSAAARRFHERVRNPLLTDISVDWGGLPVAEIYPQRIPDVFSAKPIYLSGRFTALAKGVIRIHGKLAGHSITREIAVDFPALEPKHDVLATLWARRKIDDLSMKGSDTREQVTQLGLDYKLMTQYTSFVAVEEMTVTDGGRPRRVEVPVEMPDGVSYQGVFGEGRANQPMIAGAAGVVGDFMSARKMTFASGVVGGVPQQAVRSEAEQKDLFPPGSKLSPALAGSNAVKLANNGKVDVQVFLTTSTAAAINQLKKLGFELIGQPKGGKLVIGRIPVEKVKALSELAVVTYVSPVS